MALTACGNEALHASDGPTIAVTPATLDFGSRAPGTQTTLTLAISNDGDGLLAIAAVRVEEDAGHAFSVGEVPQSIGSKAHGSLDVKFGGEAEGPAEAVLVIESNAPRAGTFRVPLKGRILPACAGSETYCAETCTDLARDPAHCGTCDTACDAAQACVAGKCAAPTCSDGVQDGPETGVDCGGSCSGCAPGGACGKPSDCDSAVCTDGICAAPTCSDHAKNENETDVDCGGRCGPCDDGEACAVDADCASSLCVTGHCTALPSLAIAGISGDEGTRLSFVVTLSAPIGADVTFSYATADQTAVAGLDYAAASGTGAIEAGTTSTVIAVDTTLRPLFQGDRSFTVSLSAPLRATIATPLATGTIHETAAEPPTDLTYAPPSLVCTRGHTCLLGAPASGGGAVVSFAIVPDLPAGLAIDAATGAISGTPTVVSPATSYTVTATNSGGATTAVISVTVKDEAPAQLTYSPASLVCTKNEACSLGAPTSTGGAVLSYEITPALPTGLGINSRTGAIAGTPPAPAPAATYTVTATNSSGSTTATLSIAVVDSAPTGLTYAPSSLVCTRGHSCLLGAPASGGGAVVSFAIVPDLPAGLAIDPTTGAISGTPTAVSPATSYTVTATNSGGATTAIVSVTVKDEPPAQLTYSPTSLVCTKGAACSLGAPTSTGGAVVSYEIAPALPTGLGINPRTGAIAGTPTALAPAATYTVTATNSGGSTTATLSISVVDSPPSGLTYAPSSLTCTKGQPCALGAPTSGGGAVVRFDIRPALPNGLVLDASTGAISGTPTVLAAAASYTVTATNSGGSATASVTVTVRDVAPATLTYSPNTLTCMVGQACSLGPPSATGGAVVTWSVSPALPAGLSLSAADGTISGSPTAVATAASYTVTAANSGGTAQATVTITVAGSNTLDLLANWYGHANAVKLSDTRMVVAYTDGASDRSTAPTSIVFRIIDRTGDTFAFSGSPVRIDIPLCPANNDQCIQLMGALGPSHFLMVTSDDTYARNYRLFTISGTSISLSQTISAGTAAWFWGHPVDDTRYIVRYRDGNSGNPVQYRVVTRTGDTISLGTAIQRPAPTSFSGLSSNEPQADAPLSLTGAGTFREIRPGYVWLPGYLSSWVLGISGSTLSASGPMVYSNSQQRTMSPHIASDGTGNTVVLYPSYSNGWYAGYFVGSTFSTNGSISDTSGYYGGQGGDSTDGFIDGAFYVRLRAGTVYRFASVSSAPTVQETGLPYDYCYNAPGVMKSGNYGVFLSCTNQGALRLKAVRY